MTSSIDVSGELRLSIVIAVFNEEHNLAALIDEINSVCDARGWVREIIVVDDGSTDDGARVPAPMANVTVVRFRRNFGQTAAFDAGCHAAQYEYIITMDGDGQNDPADIPNLIAHLQSENLDVVSGWRVNREDKFSKRFVSRGANLLRKVFSTTPSTTAAVR